MRCFKNAVYLPAVQSNYVGFDTTKSRLGWYDDSIHNFLKDNGGLYYPQALYSAGHAELDPGRSRETERMIHARSDGSILIADSGGYQWITGAWNTDWDDWLDIENVRHSVLSWQESGFDYAITLDLPSFAIEHDSNPFTKMRECLDITKQNLQFIRDNRKGNVKFLNVLSGNTEREADVWFSEVWDFPFEGWAIAGTSASDLELLLRRLIKLRDGHLLTDRDWVHVLGTGTLTGACVLTECQTQLRATTNEKLTLSYDTSSPSKLLTYRQKKMFAYRDFEIEKRSRFSPRNIEPPRRRGYAQDQRTLFEYLVQFGETKSTNVSSQLVLSDLCRAEGKVWDTLSYCMITNHNYETLFGMIEHANDVYRTGNNIPRDLMYFRDEIAPDIFKSEMPMTTLSRYSKLLKRIRLRNSRYEPELPKKLKPKLTGFPAPKYAPVWS